MADAYNVRTDGKFYYVYRMDGNVQVSQHETGAEAQRSAAIQNQRWNEQFGKKKDEPVESPNPSGWVEGQNLPEDSAFTGTQPQLEAEPEPEAPRRGRPPKSEAPNPPPGQGVSY
jgi:hypothetical protein